MLKINDIFLTVQGEGKNAGRAAWFFRMPFCNLSCSWCDTSFNTFETYTQGDLVAKFNPTNVRFAVITGGEPSMNKDVPLLIDLLKFYGFEIAMESNGTFPIPEGVDHLTVSPKREQKIHEPYYVHEDAYVKATEFKYVVDDNFDFSVIEKAYMNKLLYLSPEFNNFEKNVERIVEYIKVNPQWKISLQTHKWMNVK